MVLMTDTRANSSSKFADEEGRRMVHSTEAHCNLTHFEPGLARHINVSGDGGQAPVDLEESLWAEWRLAFAIPGRLPRLTRIDLLLRKAGRGPYNLCHFNLFRKNPGSEPGSTM